jgi:peptide/nickel transport system permease protein
MITRLLRRFLRHKGGVIGAILLLVMIAASIAAPLLTPSPDTLDPLNRLQGPSGSHVFGTDHLGRDVLAQTLWGGRSTLLIAAVSAALGITLGYLIGTCAGYFQHVDGPIMRVMDGLMTFPSIVLMICLVGVLGNGLGPLILGLTIGMIPAVARVVRSRALSARELPMVESARAIGARSPYILVRYIAPEARSVVLVQTVMQLASGIGAIAALSFLGIGLDPDKPSWGFALSMAQQYFDAWWMAVFPGLAILLTVLGCILVGDALRDVTDPTSELEK